MPHGVQIGSRGVLVLVSSCQACLGVTFLSVSVRVNNNKTDHWSLCSLMILRLPQQVVVYEHFILERELGFGTVIHSWS